MSYIPNVREEFVEKWNGEKTNEPNPYYEGNLNDTHKTELRCYDMAVEDADTFFDNLEMYEGEEEGSVTLYAFMHDEEAIKLFRGFLADYLEMDRNEMAVSMRDEEFSKEDN